MFKKILCLVLKKKKKSYKIKKLIWTNKLKISVNTYFPTIDQLVRRGQSIIWNDSTFWPLLLTRPYVTILSLFSILFVLGKFYLFSSTNIIIIIIMIIVTALFFFFFLIFYFITIIIIISRIFFFQFIFFFYREWTYNCRRIPRF